MGKTAFINARLIDGTGSEPRDGWGLVMDGARVKAVAPVGSLAVPADAEIKDLAGLTLMPGLIDAHTHLTYHTSEASLMLREMHETLEANTIKATENARTILETGCTAIGDGACRGNIGPAIRDAVNAGTIPGPKVVAAGQILCGSAGVVDHTYGFGYVDAEVFIGIVVNSPQEIRTEVRKQMLRGVDQIKVAASGLPGNSPMGGKVQDLSYEELAAAVQEAAKFGKPVHAHAHDKAGIKDAARAGVISLHSGEFVDEEGLHLMKETGCVFVPTVAWLHFRAQNADFLRQVKRAYKPTDEQIRWMLDECQEAYECCRDAIVSAFRIGTPTAIGSDGAHVFPPFDVAVEMEYFQELGIEPLQIITAATQTAARAIGRGDEWGTLEPGKAADLLVVDGDPSQNVSVLRDKSRIVMTVRDGQVVKDTMVPVPALA